MQKGISTIYKRHEVPLTAHQMDGYFAKLGKDVPLKHATDPFRRARRATGRALEFARDSVIVLESLVLREEFRSTLCLLIT